MFLHIGGKTIINSNTIVGIFDLDNTTNLSVTRDYLRVMEQEGRVINVSRVLLPKTFIVCHDEDKDYSVIYISPLVTTTIYKRMQSKLGIETDDFTFIKE